jgi:cytidylate kinase
LVAALETRVARIRQREHLTHQQARAFIGRQDRGRERYVKRYFGRDPSDALLYHLTLNTDRLSEDAAAQLICDMARHQLQPRPAADNPRSA